MPSWKENKPLLRAWLAARREVEQAAQRMESLRFEYSKESDWRKDFDDADRAVFLDRIEEAEEELEGCQKALRFIEDALLAEGWRNEETEEELRRLLDTDSGEAAESRG